MIVCAISVNMLCAQDTIREFPYAKMLQMTHKELLGAKFKFDDEKNQYVLTKMNGLNATVNILGAMSGTPTNYVPHVNDYQVLIQNGADQVAFIAVTFYDSELYHRILTFAADSGENLLETNSVGTNKTQFNYGGYAFDLSYKRTNQSAGSVSRGAVASKDQSYNTYTFLILTGVEPASDWLTKQAQKAQKRDDKGRKKQSAADLM